MTIEETRSTSVRQKHAEYLLPSVTNYYEQPVVLDSGAGMHLRDVDGREYHLGD